MPQGKHPLSGPRRSFDQSVIPPDEVIPEGTIVLGRQPDETDAAAPEAAEPTEG